MSEGTKTDIGSSADPTEAWKRWVETSWGMWVLLLEGSKEIPADPLTWFLQWYEATRETWAKTVEDVIGTEQFMQAASQFLESYTSAAGTLRRASETYFSSLQLATRADIARVAGLVVALEEKVDRFEDAFDDFAEVSARAASHDADSTLEERLARLESKLDALAAQLGEIQAAQEGTKRLEQLEKKLGSVLEARASAETKAHRASVLPTEAGRRKPRVKSVHQAEVDGPRSE